MKPRSDRRRRRQVRKNEPAPTKPASPRGGPNVQLEVTGAALHVGAATGPYPFDVFDETFNWMHDADLFLEHPLATTGPAAVHAWKKRFRQPLDEDNLPAQLPPELLTEYRNHIVGRLSIRGERLVREAELRGVDSTPLCQFLETWLVQDIGLAKAAVVRLQAILINEIRMSEEGQRIIEAGMVANGLIPEQSVASACGAAADGADSDITEEPHQYLTPAQQADLLVDEHAGGHGRRLQIVAYVRDWADKRGIRLRRKKVGRVTHVLASDWLSVVFAYKESRKGRAPRRSRGNGTIPHQQTVGGQPVRKIKGYACRACADFVASSSRPPKCLRCFSSSFARVPR